TKCSQSGDTRCKRHDLCPPRSAREIEEMEKWSFQRIRELMTPITLRGMAGNKIGCARISMMVRSMSSNARPDTLMQDRTLQAHRFLLQRTAGPYIGVKTGMLSSSTRFPLRPQNPTSARYALD